MNTLESHISDIFKNIYAVSPDNFRFFILVALFCATHGYEASKFLTYLKNRFPEYEKTLTLGEIKELYHRASSALETHITQLEPLLNQFGQEKQLVVETILVQTSIELGI